MQAIRVHHFGGLNSLVAEDVPRPAPGDGEVLLRVKAAGVGLWDAWIRSGRSVFPQPLPFTPGSDVAGLVESVEQCPYVVTSRSLLIGRGDGRYKNAAFSSRSRPGI